MIPKEPIYFKPFKTSEAVGEYQSRLPHWRQGGVTYFVTFRLADSIPQAVFDGWEGEKKAWLEERGFAREGKVDPEAIPTEVRSKFQKEFNRKLHDFLDGCHGKCELADPLAREALVTRFESVASEIGDFVIMPNHVHLLITPGGDEPGIEKILGEIKGGSAFEINKRLNRSGSLWQKDSFDHIVRSARSLEKFQAYIESNPKTANLHPDQYTHHRASYRTT